MARYEVVPVLRRRWVRNTGLVLLVLVLVFFAGGGWYFSSLIRSDALLVNPASEPDYDLEVVGTGAGVLTLVLPADPPADLLSDEILGVAWPDGYGQVGAVVARDENTIARRYTAIDGVPEVGIRVALEGDAYPHDPGARGLDHRDVVITGEMGEFPAWLVPGSDPTWVVFVHGRGAHRREALRALPTFNARGHPCLVITYRNDDGAPEVSGRLAEFGATEWQDLEAAVRYALEAGAPDVILAGYSMGGAISAAFLLNSELASQVRAVVFDAPALQLGIMVNSRAADTNLPLVPVKVPMALTVVAKWFATWRFGVDWPGIDYLAPADRYTVPMLVIHGDADATVPLEVSERLADARPDLVTLEVFPGADHVRSWNVDPERYRAVIGRFLDSLG